VRELLIAMHGNVWVERNTDGGASFCIAIPAAHA
jgi:signal transduction histidine kinase